jgi:SAM-dependent methyltransferase
VPTIAELQAKIKEFESQLEEARKADLIPGPVGPLKLDLGCGTKKEAGFHGVDTQAFPGVDTVCDLSGGKWPWADSSVDEARCSQMLEHIPNKDVDWSLVDGKLIKSIRYPRAHFLNELWRVLRPGAKATFVTPYWCSGREYGDPTHEWAPVSEWTWGYLDKQWRASEAPHTMGIYSCDFTHGYGYNLAQHLVGRNLEFQQEAIRDHKEAAQDMIATLTARK